MLNGHCNQCRKVWTLETEQGLCQWCGELASCQSHTRTLRSIKSSRRQRRRQAEVIGNGYDQLEGKWLTYYEVASRFSKKAKLEDREDLLHDIMLTFAEVARNNGHKPFTEAVMYRIASNLVANYWRGQYRLTNGFDCGNCSNGQRKRCKKEDLYADCPRAFEIESLSKPIVDWQGNMTELGELIADDKAIDIDEWLDIKTFLKGYPQRLVAIALKKAEGQALTNKERQYLWYWRRKEQQALVLS